MRRAIAEAPVGDDVYGEDPTVNRLQETVADLLGKEAALFVPSGVMANQLGIKVHTQPGDEVLVERQCHIFNYESGAPAMLCGVQLNVLDGARGLLMPEQVEAAIRPGHYWEPQPALVCLENTVNKAGGVVYPLEQMRAICAVAREHGLATHLDGARLWNASVASGVAEREYAESFDTVWVALSKGLGAPVGSVLAGTAAHIETARRYRKLFGGGMRQAGLLAAAGLYALEHHRGALAEDHANARRLAEGIAELGAFALDPAQVETNIFMFDVADGSSAAPVVEALRTGGVWLSQFGPQTIRATTHRDVSADDTDAALAAFQKLFA